MANKPKKVKIKLNAACYVGGKLRQAGEEVEVREELVEDFSVPPVQEETFETLRVRPKDELLKRAAELKVEGVTKDNNRDEIAQKILDARK